MGSMAGTCVAYTPAFQELLLVGVCQVFEEQEAISVISNQATHEESLEKMLKKVWMEGEKRRMSGMLEREGLLLWVWPEHKFKFEIVCANFVSQTRICACNNDSLHIAIVPRLQC